MKLKKNNQGQGVLEYLIITGLVGIFCLIAVKQFGEKIETRLKNVNQRIQDNLKIK